ncbi:MAG: hypothetical protein ACI9SI_001368 [Polaribacter sp.]
MKIAILADNELLDALFDKKNPTDLLKSYCENTQQAFLTHSILKEILKFCKPNILLTFLSESRN